MSTEAYDSIVCHNPAAGPDWRVEKTTLSRPLGDHDLRVRMVASGICHTDVFISCIPAGQLGAKYPRVLGHEGAGIVQEVGAKVTTAQVGDPVLLSYNYCGDCDLCNTNRHPYCDSHQLINTVGTDSFKDKDGTVLGGTFFGQSSFGGESIVVENSVVNAKDLINNQDELKLLAPLGCGLMTGSGAVINNSNVQKFDIVVVTGIGAVGLGAIMAAKIVGAKEIIAVDRIAHRLEIAKECGATKVLESKADTNLVEELKNLAGGGRISFIFETTGAIPVIEAVAQALGHRGKLVQIGVPPPGKELKLPYFEFFVENKVIDCMFLGDTTGKVWLPQMIKWWREGKFPIEKMVKYFPIQDAVKALHAIESGEVIKPIIVF